MDLSKALRLIGLARRANALLFGAEACDKAVRHGRAELLLLATDAGLNTQRRFLKLATAYEIPLYQVFSAEEFTEAIGRSNVVLLAVSEEHLAGEIKRIIEMTAGQGLKKDKKN